MTDWFADNAPKAQPAARGDWFAANAPQAPAQTLDPNQPGMQAKPSGFYADLKNMATSLPESLARMSPGTKEAFQVKDAIDDYKSIRATGKTQAQLADDSRAQAGYGIGYRALAPQAQQLGVNVQGMEQSAREGDQMGVLGHAAAAGVPVVAGAIGGEMLKTPQGQAMINRAGSAVNKLSPRGVLADRMAEVPPGERFSRQEVLDAARQQGVNLDLAQATDSKVAQVVKRANEHSLTGGPAYEANRTGNLSALEDWANSTADNLSPNGAPREQVGSQMQAALKSHLEARKQLASQQFKELDQTIGKNRVNTVGLQDAAQSVIDQNKAYYETHPELKPKQAWAIMQDLSKQSNASWSELHQLRSDLMDFYRNNPDVVKGRADAWVQQMVGKADEALTQSSAGLSPQNLAKFRQANTTWESIKNTYDNPQSPYYNAVRTQYPSNLPANLASRPEVAAQVRQTLSSLQDGSTAEGAFQRQFVENLINDKSGKLDLKNLNSKLSRTPDDVLRAMVGDEGAKNLRMLGKVSQKVTGDINPSGTAKVGQPAAEVAGFFVHPLAGGTEMAGQYGAAKAVNSPKVIDYLTKKR